MGLTASNEGIYKSEKGILYFPKISDFFSVTGIRRAQLAEYFNVTRQQVNNLIISKNRNGIEFNTVTGEIKVIRPKKSINVAILSDEMRESINKAVS